jgi:hypothetical protein
MLQSSLVGHGSGQRPLVLDSGKGGDREAMIKRLKGKDARMLSIILNSPEQRIVWRDWISYWKSVRTATNLGVGLWRGSYRNRGHFSRRLALTLIRIEL